MFFEFLVFSLIYMFWIFLKKPASMFYDLKFLRNDLKCPKFPKTDTDSSWMMTFRFLSIFILPSF